MNKPLIFSFVLILILVTACKPSSKFEGRDIGDGNAMKPSGTTGQTPSTTEKSIQNVEKDINAGDLEALDSISKELDQI